MRKIHYLLLGLVCVCLTGCVESSSFTALENRVAAIEMENSRKLSRQLELSQESENQAANLAASISAIEKQFEDSPMAKQEVYAEMKYDIDSIKANLQRLEGNIEELKHYLQLETAGDSTPVETQINRLDQAISRNYEKILQLEKYMGFEPTAAGEVIDPAAPKKVPQANAEQEQYTLAKKLFDEGDKENARIQFENFINKYPDSDNADNARFWIADSYYVEKWYEKAILEYQKVLEKYPTSNKLAAARLKQGYAFAELGEKANARLILKELIKKHPGSNEAKYATEKLKHLQ